MGDSYSTKDNNLFSTSSEQTEDGACLSAMRLVTNLVYPAVLNAAIDLNLFEIIAKATPPGAFMSASEIASKLPLPTQHSDLPNRLDRMLRLLASYSVLTCATRSTHREFMASHRLENTWYLMEAGGTWLLSPHFSVIPHL